MARRGASLVRRARLGLIALWIAVLPLSVAVGDSNLVKVNATGKARIACVCIVSTSGCALKRFDEIAGKPRKTWIQEAHVIQGHEYDASLLCYRKRDVQGHGEGLCCEVNRDERDLRFFFGKVQRIEK
jgi:hypothetical protein